MILFKRSKEGFSFGIKAAGGQITLLMYILYSIQLYFFDYAASQNSFDEAREYFLGSFRTLMNRHTACIAKSEKSFTFALRSVY